jgi:two-component system KDP operon response regulator KdpE
MPAKILVIDGNAATIKSVCSTLDGEGYQVDRIHPGVDAIRQVLIAEPDLVVLGLHPTAEGWRFCRQLLAFMDRPLLLLLSTAEKLDRARGLDLGADDCMLQPVLAVELVARVRALLRRDGSGASRLRRAFFVDGGLIVDLTRREVRLDDEPVRLTPSEYRLLSCLVRHEGEVLSQEQLLAHLWGDRRARSSGVVKQYIHHLRRKLEADPRRPQRIVTWRGEGYMLRRLQAEL